MICALDHIAILGTGARADYERLLGRRADTGGAIVLSNMRLEFEEAPAGEAGLARLAFAVEDMDSARRLLSRRGLLPDGTPPADTLILPLDATHGVPIVLVQQAPGRANAKASSPDTVSGLDHVVVRSPNPERAVALYAGRLGLSLRLDRSNPAWGMRLLFFRCGDLVIEVAHDLKGGVGDGPDRLWGLSWRVPDLSAAHARLRAAGVDVSELRTGRRPGTQVCTVRSHAGGIPTLLLGASAPRPQRDACDEPARPC